VSAAPLLAFGAGAATVALTWELTALAVEAGAVAGARRLALPLHEVGVVGRAPTADERRRLVAVVAVTLLAAGWLIGGPVAAVVVATAGPWLVGRVVQARRRRWRRALAAGAPHVARTLADALSGGHAVRGALTEAARAGGAGPVVDAELRAAAAALAVGERTTVVLERLRDRAGAPGWETVVAAVLLQRDAGGDLAGLLRALATDLEAGRRAEADAHAATAQARFTAWLVCALPLGGAVLAELAHPGVLRQTATGPLGAGLCAAALVLQGLAVVAVKRLARLEPT
jgi:tight adherence protein B